MTANLSFVRPDNDSAANTLAAWAQVLVNEAKAAGHSVQDLKGLPTVDPTSVGGALNQSDGFLYFGHGTWTTLYEGTTTLVDSTALSAASNHPAIIVAIACRSAHTLGSDAIKSYTDAYLGFDEDFLWILNSSSKYGDAIVEGLRELVVQGKTVDDAANKMGAELDLVLRYFKYGAGTTNPDATWAWLFADWDKSHIAIRGAGLTTLP